MTFEEIKKKMEDKKNQLQKQKEQFEKYQFWVYYKLLCQLQNELKKNRGDNTLRDQIRWLQNQTNNSNIAKQQRVIIREQNPNVDEKIKEYTFGDDVDVEGA